MRWKKERRKEGGIKSSRVKLKAVMVSKLSVYLDLQ